ncbi:MAG TPA: hypothetical protein VLM79_28840, partial [Kofleriaceae bacterium]|nr:hypothetical protein [Kofleriaceae bacterium]
RSNLPPRRSPSLVHGLSSPPRHDTEPDPPAAPSRPTHPRIQARGTRHAAVTVAIPLVPLRENK